MSEIHSLLQYGFDAHRLGSIVLLSRRPEKLIEGARIELLLALLEFGAIENCSTLQDLASRITPQR